MTDAILSIKSQIAELQSQAQHARFINSMRPFGMRADNSHAHALEAQIRALREQLADMEAV